ncbi:MULTISPECIES: LCP family protein [unclassified Microbacterium]|uniref:LCP family protein n=1 Tax=unclassified Microbacterium TaxID=2609290 RepID=UPI0012F9EADD|nr:LCP family protein [Microbacterium sp. MAH-37]MVQ40630.1 LytR family transcriptional regulator [Microbacterium sp. MAH-37]
MSESSTSRRPLARHGQQSSPSFVGQLLKIVGIFAAVVLVSGMAVVGYIGLGLTSTVQANAVELEGQKAVPPDIGAYEGGFNLLLTGVDTCEPKYAELFGKRCTGKDSEGTLNDVNLLVHVSAEPRRVTAVSFPRDMMVPIPSCEAENGRVSSAMSKQPLNSAWEYGGLSCVAKTISELTGEDIQFAASVTFGGVIEITNAIGGVDVCLASPIKDKYTGLDMEAGTHTVVGLEALQFLRTRHGVGDGSDLGRIGNQQQYMSSLARKMMSSETLGNIPVMLKLASTTVSNLTPSKSLADPMKLVQIGLAMKDVPLSDIVFVQYPTATDPDNPNKVVPDDDSAEEMWAAISANKQLEITHKNTKNDGVVVEDAPEATTPPATTEPGATPAPDEVAQLPSTVKGNSAAQQTCSNGNVRR